MQNLENIFINTLKNNSKTTKDKRVFVKELVFDLSRKKLYRLKDTKNIQIRISELFALFYKSLSENSINEAEYVQGIIDGLISAASFDQESRLYEKMYEKERLVREIRFQKEGIYKTISDTFETIGSQIDHNDTIAFSALNDAKLCGIEMLGILKETTEEALLTTIERGDDIEETSKIIIKNIVYQAINEGDFVKKRFLQIANSVLEVAMDIADSDQAHAEDILSGTIFGIRDGISKAVEIFKDSLKYAPEEAEALSQYNLSNAKEELGSIEDEFLELLRKFSQNENGGISSQIIEEMLHNKLDNTFAKLRRLSLEAKEAINIRLEDLKENAYFVEKELKEKASNQFENFKESVEEMEKRASQKVEELKKSRKTQEIQEEAKNLGNRAWEVAKDFLKNAKESFNKK